MKSLHLLSWCAVAAVLAALPACNRSSNQPKVGFVSNNSAEFWTIAEAGTSKAAPEFGVEVLFRRPQQGTAAQQKEIIEDLLAQGVQAIAISVKDPKNQLDYLNEIASRVPLITQDNDAPDSKRLCYIGTDNYAAGRDVGKLVKEAMPEGGTVALFVGDLDSLNAQQRRQGVLDELADQKDAPGPTKYGKYTLHHGPAYVDYTDTQKAKDNAKAALTDLQDEKNVCLIGLWAYNPPAIYSAVEDAKKLGQVKIVGMDEADNTLLGIERGHIFATVVQQPYVFGYESVKLMAALARGDHSGVPANGKMYIKHRIIRKNNPDKDNDVEVFHKHLNELLKK